MSEHIYEVSLQKTTTGSAQFVATIVPATLASGVRMPEIREIGVYNEDGANAAEIGIGIPAAAGVTPASASTVQALNQLDPAGHTTVVPSYSTPPTAPTNFYRRAEIQAVSGAGSIWVWGDGEFLLWAGATINQVVIWQVSTLAVTYDVYVKVAE